MKKIMLCFTLLMITANVFAQVKAGEGVVQKDADDSVLVKIAERWMKAYNGTDAKELEPLYSEDAQYISGHVAGLVAQGRDSVIANFAKGMKLGGHLEELEVLSIIRSCDLATVLCKYEANNAGQKASGRNLLVLKKIEMQWFIIIHMTVV